MNRLPKWVPWLGLCVIAWVLLWAIWVMGSAVVEGIMGWLRR